MLFPTFVCNISTILSSNIWTLESHQSINIKVIYDLPRATHCWVIEEITGKSLQMMLLKRFLKFTSSILKTNKPFIKFLLRAVSTDVRSNTGSNLRTILLKTGVQAVPGITLPSALKTNRLHEVPGGEEWKVPLLNSLLQIRSGNFKLEFDEEEDSTELVDGILLDVCTS